MKYLLLLILFLSCKKHIKPDAANVKIPYEYWTTTRLPGGKFKITFITSDTTARDTIIEPVRLIRTPPICDTVTKYTPCSGFDQSVE